MENLLQKLTIYLKDFQEALIEMSWTLKDQSGKLIPLYSATPGIK